MDTFPTMRSLMDTLPPLDNYFIHINRNHNSNVKLFAPHGGCIEPCTSELVLAVAENRLDYFIFGGTRKKNCLKTLHVTSTHYDEPQCLQLAQESKVAVAFHGCQGEDRFIEIGGGNTELCSKLKEHLHNGGYPLRPLSDNRKGEDERNFVNKGKRKGIQIEFSAGFRKSLFLDFPRSSQRNPATFFAFIKAMQEWTYHLDDALSEIVAASRS